MSMYNTYSTLYAYTHMHMHVHVQTVCHMYVQALYVHVAIPGSVLLQQYDLRMRYDSSKERRFGHFGL